MQTTIVNENGKRSITVFVPDAGEFKTVTEEAHSSFEDILDGVLNNDEAKVFSLVDAALTADSFLEPLTDRISIANNRVYFDGDLIDNSLSKQIVRFIAEGVEDWKPLVAFWEKVAQNPQDHSREQLFDFLNANDRFSITPTGDIVAYKGVKQGNGDDDADVFYSTRQGTAYVDGEKHEGYIPNYIGAIVTMPRNEVAGNPTVACSAGLHVATHQYAQGFGQSVIEVHVNPRDVVSVPTGESEKVRCCRYEVVGVISVPHQEAVVEPEPVAVVEVTASDDAPTENQWKQAMGRAKRRKKGVKKIAEAQGWILVGDEPKDRESWVIPVSSTPPTKFVFDSIVSKAKSVKKGVAKVAPQFGYEFVGSDPKNPLHYSAIQPDED